ncbi:MAG: hypothetical protein V1692_02450 [bacterium]
MTVYLAYWQLILIILTALVFLTCLIWFVKKKFRSSELYSLDKEEIKKRWQELEELLSRKGELNYKMAVLEADKLLDHVLKDMRFGGSSLGERLKVACYKYPNLKKVWAWHKIRNLLVHEADYHLRENEARKAIAGFKAALKELGVL